MSERLSDERLQEFLDLDVYCDACANTWLSEWEQIAIVEELIDLRQIVDRLRAHPPQPDQDYTHLVNWLRNSETERWNCILLEREADANHAADAITNLTAEVARLRFLLAMVGHSELAQAQPSAGLIRQMAENEISK